MASSCSHICEEKAPVWERTKIVVQPQRPCWPLSRLPICKRFPDVCVSQGRRWTDVSGVRLRKETVGESIWVRVGVFIETLVEAVETTFYVFEEIK